MTYITSRVRVWNLALPERAFASAFPGVWANLPASRDFASHCPKIQSKERCARDGDFGRPAASATPLRRSETSEAGKAPRGAFNVRERSLVDPEIPTKDL